jgi:hypothetical protein
MEDPMRRLTDFGPTHPKPSCPYSSVNVPPALFCKSCFGLFQFVSAYSLSQNTIESAETSRLFHQPNQPTVTVNSC